MLVFLGHGCYIHKTYRKKGNSVDLHGNRNGESLNRYSQLAFMINYLVNSLYPDCSQVTLNFIIQKFCSFILCFIVPPHPTPHTNLDPHTPIEREKQKQRVSSLPQCHTRLQVMASPLLRIKYRLSTWQIFAWSPVQLRFIHLLTKVHNCS